MLRQQVEEIVAILRENRVALDKKEVKLLVDILRLKFQTEGQSFCVEHKFEKGDLELYSNGKTFYISSRPHGGEYCIPYRTNSLDLYRVCNNLANNS